MVVEDFSELKRPSCYFCGGGGMTVARVESDRMKRRRIRTNDGDVITDWVCADCDPRR